MPTTTTIKITRAQLIDYDSRDGRISIVSAPVPAYVRSAIASALTKGEATIERAGPGWGSHNAVIRVGTKGLYDVYAPEYGDWLVTTNAEGARHD